MSGGTNQEITLDTNGNIVRPLANKPRREARALPERTPADYAIEFGEYLAKAAEAYIAEVNKVCVRLTQTTVDFSNLGEGNRTLAGAIYEFRKRAERARP